jgi:hypothetical protein
LQTFRLFSMPTQPDTTPEVEVEKFLDELSDEALDREEAQSLCRCTGSR